MTNCLGSVWWLHHLRLVHILVGRLLSYAVTGVSVKTEELIFLLLFCQPSFLLKLLVNVFCLIMYK